MRVLLHHMLPSFFRCKPAAGALVAGLLSASFVFLTPATARAADLLTTNVQGSGANWTAALWRTNNGSGVPTGPAMAPVPGNTYEEIFNGVLNGNGVNNTRIRNPASAGVQTFPGDSLTMNTNTELRAKQPGAILNFPGVGGNPGLILNGGMLNGGDDATFPITGYIRVTSPSFISHGANGAGGGTSANRAFDFQGILDGAGSIQIINAGTNVPQKVSGNNNTFSGEWIVTCGWLQANGSNSLGTNSIIIDPNNTDYLNVMPNASSAAGPAVFEAGYNINSAGSLTLANGGLVRLHQNCAFTAVNIEGDSLSPGTHLYSELFSKYSANFAAGGYGSITVQAYGALPLVLPQIITPPSPEEVYAGDNVTLSAAAFGDQLSYQWLSNGVALADGGAVSGSATATLLISAVAVSDEALFSLIVSNAAGAITSSPAALTIISPGGAEDTAVAANGAVIYYPLNELGDPSTNTPCYDVIGGKTGVYGAATQNGFNGVAGPRPTNGFPGFAADNAAALFTAVADSRITLPPFNFDTSVVTNLTISAWVNPNSTVANSGILFCREGTTVAGLVIGTNGASLGYNWNNNASTYNFNSGITVPPNIWSFVAVAITPSNATLYLINTNTFQTAVNTVTNPPLPFDGHSLIGDDALDSDAGTRVFDGFIDDVAIFTNSLSISQLIDLYAAGSGNADFSPNILTPPQNLSLFDGQTATFTVQASGPSLKYQWQAAPTGSSGPYTNLSNGGQFSGVNSPTLTILNITNVNALDYVVAITNISGFTNTYYSPASLGIEPVGPPEDITLSCQDPSGSDWNITTGCGWSDGNAAATSAVQNPGSTYTVLPGGLLRTPAGAAFAQFPTANLAYGYLAPLTIDGNGVFLDQPAVGSPTGIMKFKANLTSAITYFPKLIMNGGELDNAGSPSGLWIIQGEMDIESNTVIFIDSGGGSGRPFEIDSWLTGGASIEYRDFDTTLSGDLNITGKSNTYHGTWNVVVGALLGSASNSLGTNSITVGPRGFLETTYNLNNSNATLFLNGQMFLHANDTFGKMYITNAPVPAGTYSYPQLVAAYPSFFPTNWPKLIGSNTNAASGSIRVLNTGLPFPVTFASGIGVTNAEVPAGAVLSYSANVSGGTPPYTYQWYLNGQAVDGATNATFSTSGSSGSNSVYVVVNNGGIPATNGFGATFTVNPTGSVITFADTNNWQVQGVVAAFSPDGHGGNQLTLTTDSENENGSAFYKIGQYIGSFNTSFDYIPSGTLNGDGVTFCVQNTAAGPRAIGIGNGIATGYLGYFGISNSAAVGFNIYTGSPVGVGFSTDGATFTFGGTDNLALNSGDPIHVQIAYAQGNISLVLTDAVAAVSFTTNIAVGDLTEDTGSAGAYIGLTGATAATGQSANQIIDNFSYQYTSGVVAASPILTITAANGALTISWPGDTDPGYHLQQSAALLPASWANVATAPTSTNGTYQVTLTPAGAAEFYRLISP